MIGSRGRHESIVDDLAERVRLWYPNTKVIAHFVYPIGEMDIMQYMINEGTFTFNNYEIKSNDTLRGRQKAKEQLERFKNYLEKIFKREDKRIFSHYVYGVGRDSYALVDLGSYEGLELKIGGYK